MRKVEAETTMGGRRIASTILSVSGGTRKWIIGIFLRLSLVVVVLIVVVVRKILGTKSLRQAAKTKAI
jgi:hypothetical protein